MFLEPALHSRLDYRREPLGRNYAPVAPHPHEPRSFAARHAEVIGEDRRARPECDDFPNAHLVRLQNVDDDCNTQIQPDTTNVPGDMDTPSERLRQARIAAGYATAADAARFHNWVVVTYQAHESGSRGLKPHTAKLYGATFGVSDGWLLTGKGGREATGVTVKIVGYVGAGAELLAFANDEPGDGLGEIEVPAGTSPEAVAVIVRGESNFPIFEDGEVLIYSERRSDVDSFLYRSKPLIIGLKDGRRLLKQVAKGRHRGQYTLMSPNAAPIEDVEIEWVSRIDWTRPRR